MPGFTTEVYLFGDTLSAGRGSECLLRISVFSASDSSHGTVWDVVGLECVVFWLVGDGLG